MRKLIGYSYSVFGLLLWYTAIMTGNCIIAMAGASLVCAGVFNLMEGKSDF